MPRTVHVYPKALIEAATWTFLVKTFDPVTRVSNRFVHTVPAGVTAETPVTLLKLSFDLTVGDADLDSAIDASLFSDLIDTGRDRNDSVWQVWQTLAEGILGSLPAGYTVADFEAGWSPNDTNRIRNGARNTMLSQRGWTIDVGTLHQHEGDGTVTVE